jgi:signal transduction histidine kinase
VLNGEKPQNIPREKGANTYIFDSRVMERWGLKEENLPPGSILINRQFTVWELYKRYIIFGFSLVLLQTALISGLVAQRARRRKAEAQRQLAAEALTKMSRRLIRAQEQERQRIARELHDNLGQELAFMNVSIDTLLEKSDPALNASLTDLSSQLSAIAETIREVSHGLYPTQLEYLGLPKALRKLCDEVQRGNELAVRLSVGALNEHLQAATALSLYRVAQETLHNIVTHSHARNVQVDLASVDGQLWLRIVDDGVGFDVSHKRDGLGLASMRERILALGGSIDISSSRTAGTKVEVRVPLQEISAGAVGAD